MVASKYKDKKDLVFAALDVKKTKPYLLGIKATGYPSIKAYPKGETNEVEFWGHDNELEFTQFLEEILQGYEMS